MKAVKELEASIQRGIIYRLLLVRIIANFSPMYIERFSALIKFLLHFHTAFRKPYLFIIHFSSVEIMKLDQESYTSPTKNPERILIELSSPRYLGVAGPKGIYLVSVNCFLELLKIDGPSNIPYLNGSLTSLNTLYVITHS